MQKYMILAVLLVGGAPLGASADSDRPWCLSDAPSDGWYVFPKTPGFGQLPELAIVGGCVGMDDSTRGARDPLSVVDSYRIDGWVDKAGSANLRLYVSGESIYVKIPNRSVSPVQVLVSLGGNGVPVNLQRKPDIPPLIKRLRSGRSVAAAAIEDLGSRQPPRSARLQRQLDRLVASAIKHPPTVPHEKIVPRTPLAMRILQHGLASDRVATRAARTAGLAEAAGRGLAKYRDLAHRIKVLRRLVSWGSKQPDDGDDRDDKYTQAWQYGARFLAESLKKEPPERLLRFRSYLEKVLSSRPPNVGMLGLLDELPFDNPNLLLRATLRTSNCKTRRGLVENLEGTAGNREHIVAIARGPRCRTARQFAARQLVRQIQDLPEKHNALWKVAMRAFRFSNRCLGNAPADGYYHRPGYSDFQIIVYKGCIGFELQEGRFLGAKNDAVGNVVTRWRENSTTDTFVFRSPKAVGGSEIEVVAYVARPIKLVRWTKDSARAYSGRP